ncbi:MAG TPA: AAA family ATPase [Chloroflexota bacterium]|nr:AAA family ATPase [Chloroflexota bacterium]
MATITNLGAAWHGRSPIVGREAELAVLDDFLTSDQSARALVLSGAAGIGKTTLWEVGLRLAQRRRFRVLAARPGETEVGMSFAGLSDLFDEVDLRELADVPTPQLRALEVVLLRAEPRGSPPGPPAIAIALLSALRTLACRGTVLVAIDESSWLDRASAEALAFAVRRLRDEPVLFLLVERPGSSSVLARAVEPTRLQRLELGPLTPDDVLRVLSELPGPGLPRRALRRVLEEAQGNPLFARELARTLAARGAPTAGEELPIPAFVEDLVGARVARLPRAVRSLLLAVALCPELPVSQLGEIADETAIDHAVDEGLLFVDGPRARLSHPLVVAAARGRSRAGERRALHRALAAALADPELRARHLALAATRPDAKLAAGVAAAAARAAARGAVENATVLADHALRLTPPGAPERVERLLALAEHLLQAGEPGRAIELLGPSPDRLPTGSARARAHLLLADESRFAASDLEEADRHLQRALAESEGDPALRAVVVARRARYTAVARVELVREAEAWALDALPTARLAGPDVERQVLHGLAWARVLRGHPVEDLAERFRAISEDAFPIFGSLDRVAAERLAHRGEVHRAREALSQLRALADERGETWAYVRLLLGLCEVEMRAGDWRTAGQLLDELDRSPDRELLVSPAYQRCRALLAAGTGRAEEAVRRAQEAIESSEARGLRWDLLEALRAHGLASLLAGDPARAVESLGRVWEHTRREGVDDPGVFPVAPDLVEALVQVGSVDEARAVTDRLRTLAEEQAHPWGLATAGRCGGLVGMASADPDGAGVALERAAAAYDELGLRFDRARTLLALGRAERRLGRRGAARRPLDDAAASFDEIGSPGWADQARAELARLGGRRPRPSDRVTAAEERVVRLAADGLTNKEIARSLHLGVHTVEVHLSRAYQKLGVRSRAQLARLFVPSA